MENQRTQVKVAMNYGTLSGLSGVVVFLLFYFMGMDLQSKIPSLVGYLILIIFIVIGIKSYRDEDLGGYIGYGKSLGTGTLISIFGGIISAVFMVLFFNFIAPEVTQKIMENAQQKLVESGMNEEQIEQAMIMTQKFMTPFWLFTFSVLSAAFVGFVLSLIISIFLRKEQNPFNSNLG